MYGMVVLFIVLLIVAVIYKVSELPRRLFDKPKKHSKIKKRGMKHG